jgi:hypothetical protein
MLRGFALTGTVLLFQIIAPTGSVLLENWNFGISTGYT